MAHIDRKTEIAPVDGTPDKRMFWSIISDYDLKSGICELIDNAIDMWMTSGRKKPLVVCVELDPERQIVDVEDDAGGVSPDELRLLVAPGGSKNNPLASVIGIFGVGSKRAGIAIGDQVELRTRKGSGRTVGIDITPEWLTSPTWELPAYEFPGISENSTRITITKLRRGLNQDAIDGLEAHLSETYGEFLSNECRIVFQGDELKPLHFDQWAYPPDYGPKRVAWEIDIRNEGTVSVELTGGLITDRDPEAENYGAYFYCNDRLILSHLKSRDVGYYVSAEAGVPHPDASLARVIVRLHGPARLMPWTSTKSGINFDHVIFREIRPQLIELLAFYTKVSRRTKKEWEDRVFSHPAGTVDSINPDNRRPTGRMSLPPLPQGHKSHIEHLKTRNAAVLREKPWTLGLVEALGAVEVVTRQRFQTGNRIALILLDSNFEIALKEFIVHRTDLFPKKDYSDQKIAELFSKRHKVLAAIREKTGVTDSLLSIAEHYYEMRNKLIHERASMTVSDADIANYRSTVEQLLGELFDLDFGG